MGKGEEGVRGRMGREERDGKSQVKHLDGKKEVRVGKERGGGGGKSRRKWRVHLRERRKGEEGVGQKGGGIGRGGDREVDAGRGRRGEEG